jgi:tetratricopeptide (TPR) repeat protein
MPDTYQNDVETDERPVAVSSRPPGRSSIFADPVVRVMAVFVVLLVVLYLVTVLSALLMGILNPTEPRTRGERDIRFYEMLAAQSPKDTGLWKRYINALMTTKQYLKAQDVIDRASASVDQTATQDFLTAQAELYLATKKYDQAIKTSDQVRTKLKAFHDASKQTPGTAEAKGEEINENYWRVLLVKAEAQVAVGNEKAAVEALDTYIKEKPTAADALVRRGLLRIELGDKAGAEADFRAALTYVPDDPAALDGLKKIGVTQ